MTKEQEDQQADTIADTKARHNSVYKVDGELCVYDSRMAHIDREILLEIVDSQAQKIASMEENSRLLAGMFFDEKEALGIQIAEQKKEIERLKFKVKATEIRCANG